MLYMTTMAIGAVFGGSLAYFRKGNGFDIAQYAGVFAIIGFILGIITTISLARVYGV